MWPRIIRSEMLLEWMLAIDTCAAQGGVALAHLQNGQALVVAQRELPGRETQERLMVAIREVLSEADLTVQDLRVLAVCHGPGSFTGVRIGVAAIKGLAEVLGTPVVAISRLRLLAARAQAGEEPVAAWLDAGRGDVYVGLYRKGKPEQETMLSRDAARQLEGRIVVGEELLRAEGAWVGAPAMEDLVQLATQDAQEAHFADVLTLDANYLRIPDAELALKARA